MLNEDEKKTILDLYQHGKGTIQDYARIYRVDVPVILELLGEQHLSQVTIPGDMIDQAEAGANAQMKYSEQADVPFTTNWYGRPSIRTLDNPK